MNKMLFAAAALSLVLSAPSAFAQGSNQGTPNSQHGSGDMMQDGPHASNQQQAPSEAPTLMGDRKTQCYAKWKDAEANNKTGGMTKAQYLQNCLNNPG